MSQDLASLVSRLEAVTTRLESCASKGGSSPASSSAEGNTEIVEDYDKFMSGEVSKLMSLSNQIGGDLAEQAKLLHNGFKAQRDFLVVVSKHKAPSPDMLQTLLKPTSASVSAVQEFREKHRSSKVFSHLSAISEAVPCLGWVTVVKGAIYIKETLESAQFYLNRVIKDHKTSDPKHCDWAKAVKSVFEQLMQYTKDHHAAGLKWNPSGPPAVAGGAPSGAGAPPPPPPPAVLPPSAPAGDQKGQDTGVASAVFSQINKAGTNIASGLRKVTDDMKTHKNPNLRSSSVVPSKPQPAAKAAPKPATPVKKPPVFENQGGKKWVVDYQVDNRNLVINGEMHQTVYMYMCKGSTLQVKGKVNSITLDNCKKCAVVFDNVVATCEFINCQSVQCQVTGKVPTISIDKTDGCQVFLSKDSIKADIVSAKSSEMNVLIPKPDGDMAEYPLPEQYKTKWNGKAFVTVPADN